MAEKERDLGFSWGPGETNGIFRQSSSSHYTAPPAEKERIIGTWEDGRKAALIAPATMPLPSAYGNYVGKEYLSGSIGSRQTFNPVYHTKLQGESIALLLWFKKYTITEPQGWLTYPFWRHAFPTMTQQPVSATEVSAFHRSHPVGLDVRARAWHNMQPRFDSDVSLINTLYELKDFKYAVSQLLKKNKKDTSLLDESIRGINKLVKNVVRDPSRPIAGAWLAYHLAYLPTIKDATAILNQINNLVRDEQRKFSDEGESLQTSHYSEDLGSVETGSVGTGNYYWRTLGVHQSTKFTATLQYTYNYKMRDTADAWRKYWGLNGSFEAFWNMIPFSFVADYFVGIGKSIRAMEHDPNVDLTQHVYGESIKTSVSRGYYINSDTRGLVTCCNRNVQRDADNTGLLLVGYKGSIYDRYRTAPYFGPAPPKRKVPKTKQLLTMAALVRCIL